MGISHSTMRKWKEGTALPDRSLWAKVEEAMGTPKPDPRVPDQSPAEREPIAAMLLLINELRLLRESMHEASGPGITGLPRSRRPRSVSSRQLDPMNVYLRWDSEGPMTSVRSRRLRTADRTS
jgi:hypothetical protein